MTALTTGILGGEDRAKRAGLQNPVIRWTVIIGLLLGFGLLFHLIGVLIGGGLGVAVYVASLASGGDQSALHNWEAKLRWRRQTRMGFDTFIPVAQRPVNCQPGTLEWNAYRDWPDGIDEWEWLGDRADGPGISYHAAPEGVLYFAVTFRVDGALVGLAGDNELETAQTAFGHLMEGWASRQKLVTALQITTRMLPSRTELHQAWMMRQLDPATPRELVADYAELLRTMASGRLVQRHYVTIRWDKTDRFDAEAVEHAKGRAGWEALLLAQVDSARQRLVDAGYNRVEVQTAPQLAAAIRHLQNPSFHPDQTADLTATGMYRASQEQETSVTTDGAWVHRTAQFAVDGIETAERDGLWLHPLLGGLESQVYRTVSIHIVLVPAADAKAAAKRDAVRDRAEIHAAQEKGSAASDETEVSLTAAQRRKRNLRPGTGHHGATWAGFVTITVPAGSSVPLAASAVEEAADACGINRLAWCDKWQAAAQCRTWPMARALPPAPITRSSKMMQKISLRTGGR